MHDTARDHMPEGYVIVDPDDPFEMYAGPLYAREQDGERTYGFRVQPHHANSGGAIHGGMLLTFADYAMCCAAIHGVQGEAPITVSLNADFTAPAQVGEIVTARIDILRRTRSLVFARGELAVGDRVVLGCSGVIKRLKLDMA